MITLVKEFELSVNAFKLMTPVEQGLVLVFFRASKISGIIDAWVDSVHKVVKNSK